jgi:hypothetical protein
MVIFRNENLAITKPMANMRASLRESKQNKNIIMKIYLIGFCGLL